MNARKKNSDSKITYDLLVKLYSDPSRWRKGVRKVAKELGVSAGTIYTKAHRMNLSTPRGSTFSPEEIKFIKENVGTLSFSEIAQALGKTYWQVYNFYRRYLKKDVR